MLPHLQELVEEDG